MLLIFCFFISFLHSQIVVNTNYTPQELVQNFLVGNGVIVSNVTFTGQTSSNCSQIGYFTGGGAGTNVSIPSGIVLTTGCVHNISQVGSAFMSDNLGGAGVPELTTLAGSSTNDGAVLEFDFIPLATPISFSYIFGSEEYPEWVGSSFNDAFAFFVSGPNPAGGNYNNVNIALIPNTSLPVTINNINQSSYPQYYIDNNNSSIQPVFDGLTTELIAQLDVIPCQQYHIKICIADAGDQAYDSGVFIKSNSFSTDFVSISTSYTNINTNYAIEGGCSDAIVTFSLSSPAASPVVVNYTLSGTAINGVDFPQIPTSITIPAGQTSVSIVISPINDGIDEGIEILIITADVNNPCGPNLNVSDTVFIYDSPPVNAQIVGMTNVCDYELPITLTVTPQGGAPPYNYSWSTGETSQSIQISPQVGSHSYNVTVIDACNSTTTASITININPTPTSTFFVSDICINEIANVIYTGNASSNAQYNWDFGAANVISGTGAGPYQLSFIQPGNYIISLQVIQNGCQSQITQQQIQVYPLDHPMCCQMPTPYAGPDKMVCNLTTDLEAVPSMNGFWTAIPPTVTFSNIYSPTTTVTVNSEGTYLFIWKEEYNPECWNADTVMVSFYLIPTVSAGENFNICSHNFQLNAYNDVGVGTWSVTPSDGVQFSDVNDPHTNVSVQQDGSYTFTWTVDNNGCVSSAQVVVNSYKMPTPSAGNDTSICGLSYVLNATPDVGVGSWQVIPSNVTISNYNDPNASIIVPYSGTYLFIWKENNNGCVNADTISVNFTLMPTSDFTVTPINCYGDVSMVVYTGIYEGEAEFNWNWGEANVYPGVGPGPHYITYTSPGVHQISLQVISNNCQSTITTNSLHNPDSLYISLSKSDVICFGQNSGSISLSIFGGTPPYNIYWSNGTYDIQQLENIPAGLYLVTVTDSKGCSYTSGVEVKQPTKLTATITPSQTICIGQTTNVTLTVNGGTPPYTYYFNGQQSNSTIIVSPQQNTSYNGYVVDQNGCVSETLSTTIYVAPPINVQLLSNTDIVCPNDPVMLSLVVTGGVGPPYIIYDEFGNVLTLPIIVYPEQTTTYKILIEDACGTKDTSQILIKTFDVPNLNVFVDTIQGCAPLTVNFIETSPETFNYYEWNFGDNSNLSHQRNPTHTFFEGGVYTVTLSVITKDGCKISKSYPNLIKVWNKPKAKFIWYPEIITDIENEVYFTNQTEGGNLYIWSFGDGDSSILKHPSHKYLKSGEYVVELISLNEKGCSDTAFAKLKVLETIAFYVPNAFSPDGNTINDKFFIKAKGINPDEFLLQIYDRWGNIIWSTNVYYPELEQSEEWDGTINKTKVPPGAYTWYLKFKDINGITVTKTGSVIVIR